MVGDAEREARRRMWGGVASGYGSQRGSDGNRAEVTDWLVSRSDPQPGQVVLAGELGHRVARDVGPDCRVLCERDATRRAVMEAFSPYRQPDESFHAPARVWGVLAR